MTALSPKTPNLSGLDLAFDFNNFMSDQIGTENGLEAADVDRWVAEVEKPQGLHDRFLAQRTSGDLSFVDLPYDVQAASRVKELAEMVRDRFDTFVLLGIGGSALGPRAIHGALAPFYYNDLEPAERGGCPSIYFCDHIDPTKFSALLRRLDPKKTVFNVVSKSGATAETLAQYLVVRQWLEQALGPQDAKDHVIITTDPRQGDLRTLCNREDLEGLNIPSGVGGRYSCLSPVGLFPAAVAGLDIDGIIGGARSMDQRCRRRHVWENPAYVSAIVGYLFATKKKKPVQVLVPYSESLLAFADWFCQLHAESLGKKGRGSTPVAGRGVADQHSQLQLWLDGPNDKTFTFMHVERFAEPLSIPVATKSTQEYQSFSYLAGKSLSELLHAERRATEAALTVNKRPNATIHIPVLCAETLGQLIFLYEMQTAFAGLLYEVNPFDQPAVELGKRLTFHLMGRSGFEKKPSELVDGDTKSNRFLI